MKTLWVHAGLPKNGSSALQVFFAKFREQLIGEGLDYIEMDDISAAKRGEITSGNGALLSRSMLFENHEAYYKDNDNLYDQLLKYVEKCKEPMGLLSSEFFAVTPLPKVNKLKIDLQNIGVTLKFIYYVRRQDQFLISTYMQRVKRHGYTGYPGQYILENYKNIYYLKYFGYASELEKILGEGNVVPLIYETTKDHPKGLVGHFSEEILGICPGWIVSDPVINSSLSPLELKLMLVANKYSPRMRFSDFLVQDSIDSGRSQKYGLHSIVPPHITSEVLDYFQEQNQKFEEKYGLGRRFPEHNKSEFVDIESLELSTEDIMDIFMGYLVRYDKRLAKIEN